MGGRGVSKGDWKREGLAASSVTVLVNDVVFLVSALPLCSLDSLYQRTGVRQGASLAVQFARRPGGDIPRTRR